MAGTSGARTYTEADKARVLVTLASNDGNVKRTSRDCDNIAPATIRKWRDQARTASTGQGVAPASPTALAVATGVFVTDAQTTRNMALDLLRARIKAGDIKTSELITAVGVLDDKVRLASGLANANVAHTHQHVLPSREELRQVLLPFVELGIANAARRHEEILEADVVDAELVALPPTS